PESSWWLVWNQIRSGHATEAIAACQLAEQRYPQTKTAPRLAFWQGKMLERLNRKPEALTCYRRARATYPGTYYAWRSAARASALEGKGDRGWSTLVQRRLPQ